MLVYPGYRCPTLEISLYDPEIMKTNYMRTNYMVAYYMRNNCSMLPPPPVEPTLTINPLMANIVAVYFFYVVVNHCFTYNVHFSNVGSASQ